MLMETLVISPGFTVEDIYKIRGRNYERIKDMTVTEKLSITIIPARNRKERLNYRIRYYIHN